MPFDPATFRDNPLRTRDDLQRLARDLVAPLLDRFSPGRASVRLGENRGHFGDRAGGLEGYARPLWGLVPLAAGGGAFAHWPLWLEGLANGSDAAHAEYWGVPGDFDQRSVEQAAFGFALAATPDQLWQPLAPVARANLSRWLRSIDDARLVDNNWRFFRVLVHLGLRSVGELWSIDRIRDDLDMLETFAVDDGWYSDGAMHPPTKDGRTGDYYGPMAFHLYGLIYARHAADLEPERAARLKDRARRFADGFQHYFAADGAAIPFGRSLTYRFAQGAFWGALAYADVEALPWPVVKGLYLRHLRWWLRQPIFTDGGVLSLGYAYPSLSVTENYNSAGSPYWAMKALLPLACAPDHPFWQADEAPLPARAAVRTLPGAQLVLTTDPQTRDVAAINPGQTLLDWPRNAPHKYCKAAYSSRFGFSAPVSVATPGDGGFDCDLALSDDGGRYFRRRDWCVDSTVGEGVAYSRWQAWPDVGVRTWLIAGDAWHVRLHRVTSGRPLRSLECGFAAGCVESFETPTASNGAVVVTTPDGASMLRDLLPTLRDAGGLALGPNSSITSSLSAMPTLRGEHAAGTFWLACVAAGSADAAARFDIASRLSVSFAGGAVALELGGLPWWRLDDESGLGTSSADRLRSLAMRV